MDTLVLLLIIQDDYLGLGLPCSRFFPQQCCEQIKSTKYRAMYRVLLINDQKTSNNYSMPKDQFLPPTPAPPNATIQNRRKKMDNLVFLSFLSPFPLLQHIFLNITFDANIEKRTNGMMSNEATLWRVCEHVIFDKQQLLRHHQFKADVCCKLIKAGDTSRKKE